MREKYKDSLWLLLMAALCVLLVACANIANLLLARGLKDRQQTAVRAALGASRARLVRKALTESLTLSVFGAVAGIAVAYAGARLILRLAITGPDGWVPVNPAPSTPVLLFALGISVITGVVFGMAPAWMALRAEPIEVLRGANLRVARNRGVLGTAGAQKMLVIVQAAASVVLVSAAAMLGQSLRNLERQNFGFDTGGRYLVSIGPRISGYKQEQLIPLFREIEDHLRAIPGVRMVSSVLGAPLTGWVWPRNIRIDMAVWSRRACAGRCGPLRRDCLWRAAADERDRRAHGAGRGQRFGSGYGAARSLRAGSHRAGAGHSGSDRRRASDHQSAFRGSKCAAAHFDPYVQTVDMCSRCSKSFIVNARPWLHSA